MARARSYAHWIVPTTLIVSFTAGIALVIGHHYFYSTLHMVPIDQARWSQDTNNSVGTAFAFLVRAALVITISTTFWQVFWSRLRRPLPLSTIDDLSSQLRTLYQLLNPSVLKASPLLSALALLAWLIPLAVIFPPASLKVLPLSVPSQAMQVFRVPNYNNSGAFVASNSRPGGVFKRNGMGQMPYAAQAFWDGPSAQVRRGLLGVAYQGQLPVFTSPEVNSSYRLEFDGPSIQCEHMNHPNTILADLANPRMHCMNGSSTCDLYPVYGGNLFLSWVANENGTVAFKNSSLVGGEADLSSIGTDFHSPEALFIAYRDKVSEKGWQSGHSAILNCTLYNSTYTVAFNFTNGRQDIKIEDIRIENATTIVEPPSNLAGAPSFPEALGANSAEVLSHLGIMQVLGELLVGQLHYDGLYRTEQTHVLETNLAFTHELYPMYLNYTSNDQNITAPGLMSLEDSVEELFQNMTLSLLTIPALLADQQDRVVVSISETLNMYNYNWRRLWMAYGSAMVATLIAICVGMFNLIATGSSYSNKFSTVVRISRDESLGVFVKEEDRFGQDPLPEYLETARLVVKGIVKDTASLASSITAYERVSLRPKSPSTLGY